MKRMLIITRSDNTPYATFLKTTYIEMYTVKYCGGLSSRKGCHKSTQYIFFKLNTTIYTHHPKKERRGKKSLGHAGASMSFQDLLILIRRKSYQNLKSIALRYRVISVYVINTLSTQIKRK